MLRNKLRYFLKSETDKNLFKKSNITKGGTIYQITNPDTNETANCYKISGYNNSIKTYKDDSGILFGFDIDMKAGKTYKVSVQPFSSNNTTVNRSSLYMPFLAADGSSQMFKTYEKNDNIYNSFGDWGATINRSNLPQTISFTITPTADIVHGILPYRLGGGTVYILADGILIEEV